MVLALVTAVVLGALVSVALGPRATLGDARTGDPALLRDVQASAGSGRGLQSLSVARIQDGTTSFAGRGEVTAAEDEKTPPSPHTPYELGSITKTWTGMLLADAVDRGEMRLDAPLSTYLPELAGTPAGGVTLEAVATHRSGLPRLPDGSMRGGLWAQVTNTDPYDGWTTERVIDSARTTELENPGTFSYSNLGMSLLGHAEARAAGIADWPTLARQRIFTPLGMTETRIVPDGGDDLPGLAQPHLAGGHETEPWSADGQAPAGASTRTTAADMTRFASAVLAGRAPGMKAVEPRADASDGRRIGLAWFTSTDDRSTYLRHNGGTGGSSSMIVIDREHRRAAVVLGNSATSIDHVAIDLIGHESGGSGPAEPWSWVPVALAVLLALVPWWKAWRGRNRLELASAVVDAGTGAVLAWTRGAWNVVPEWLLGSILAVAFVGAVFAVLRMRDVPTRPERGTGAAVLSLVVSVLVFGFFALAL